MKLSYKIKDPIYEFSTTTAYSYDDWKTVYNIFSNFGGMIPDVELLDKINQEALRLTVSPIRIAMFLTR